VPESLQGSDFFLQRVELGALTHRSLLPVSKTKRRLCFGVPKVTLEKYRVSYNLLSAICQ
jgi:hypothetical protein